MLYGGREKLALKLRLELGLVTGGTAKRKSIGTTGYHKKMAYGRGDVDGEMMGKEGSLPWALAGPDGAPKVVRQKARWAP